MGLIDERERHDLHTWAVETMGDERADIFMRSLPPRGSDALVTKDDVEDIVARHATVLRCELADWSGRLRPSPPRREPCPFFARLAYPRPGRLAAQEHVERGKDLLN